MENVAEKESRCDESSKVVVSGLVVSQFAFFGILISLSELSIQQWFALFFIMVSLPFLMLAVLTIRLEDKVGRSIPLYDAKIHRTPGTKTMMTDLGIQQLQNRLTEFGKRVAQYIKNPTDWFKRTFGASLGATRDAITLGYAITRTDNLTGSSSLQSWIAKPFEDLTKREHLELEELADFWRDVDSGRRVAKSASALLKKVDAS